MGTDRAATLNVRPLAIAELKAHPRNYREHPLDQIEELRQSIREFGCWANASVSADGYILRNHGIIQAAGLEGFTHWPCEVRDFNHDDPRALKMLVADNQLYHLAEDDDRLLADLLKEVRDTHETGLLATGFDDMMLANLVMVTRTEGEIADFNAAAEWVGMPSLGDGDQTTEHTTPQLVVSFKDESDRDALVAQLGLEMTNKNRRTWSCWWPPVKQLRENPMRFTA